MKRRQVLVVEIITSDTFTLTLKESKKETVKILLIINFCYMVRAKGLSQRTRKIETPCILSTTNSTTEE